MLGNLDLIGQELGQIARDVENLFAVHSDISIACHCQLSRSAGETDFLIGLDVNILLGEKIVRGPDIRRFAFTDLFRVRLTYRLHLTAFD